MLNQIVKRDHLDVGMVGQIFLPPESNVDMPQAAPAHSLGALTLGELGIPAFALLTFLWLRWFQKGGSFLWKRTADPMRRMGVGIFFSLAGIFLQSLTEWVFRETELEVAPMESTSQGPIYASRRWSAAWQGLKLSLAGRDAGAPG